MHEANGVARLARWVAVAPEQPDSLHDADMTRH